MFKKWFNNKQPSSEVDVPELIGLRLGGAFELDALMLKLVQPELIIEGAASTQFIQAVGFVQLDENSSVLRYYTDDDGFIQILLDGGISESNISDVKLWYFYSTSAIANETEWNQFLNSGISQPTTRLEGHEFHRVWGTTSTDSPPIAITETTYTNTSSKSQTDQFVMLYERELNSGKHEFLTIAGEEKLMNGNLDRVKVVSTGFDLQPSDLNIIG